MIPPDTPIHYQHQRYAPRTAPCPRCGTPGRRKQYLSRLVRGLAYKAILLVRVTTAA